MTNKSEALRELAAVMEKHGIAIASEATLCDGKIKADAILLVAGSAFRETSMGFSHIEKLADQLAKGDGDE